MITVIMTILIIITIGTTCYGIFQTKTIREVKAEAERISDKLKKTLHQKKSSEVRLGFLTEHLAPLLDEFPYDVKDESVTIVPLGNPIDYFVVTDDEIGFVEVKTGVSQLNKAQKHIKKLVLDKKIVWHLLRVKPNVIN